VSSNNINGTANKRGTKRKATGASTYDPSSPISASTPLQSAQHSAKRTRSQTMAGRRASTVSFGEEEEEEEDDSLDSPSPVTASNGKKGSGPRKPETEEEKRKNFLERNRQAALKCRQRKKAWLSQLQARVEFLQNENESLSQALMSAREEITRLSALVGTGGVAGVGTVTVVPSVVPVSGVANGAGGVNGVSLSSATHGQAHASHAPNGSGHPNSHQSHNGHRPSQSPSGPGAPGSITPMATPQAGMVGAGGGRGYGY